MTRILLTNDDGIDSPGLASLRRALDPLGQVVTIAPLRNQSAVARSITIGRELRLRRARFGDARYGFALDGTPVDCVRVALLGAVAPVPDVVVSGVNLGANLGNDASYSGTVGAVLEACLHGLPGMAVSVESRTPQHLESVEPLLAQLVGQLILRPLPRGVVVNVNVPERPANEILGVRVTSLGGASCHDRVVLLDDDGRREDYDVSCEREANPASMSDFDAVDQGYVSLTPLHYELTSQPGLAALAGWRLDDAVGAGEALVG